MGAKVGRGGGEGGGGGETATLAAESERNGVKKIMWCKVYDYSVAAGKKKQGWEEQQGEGGKGETGRDKL